MLRFVNYGLLGLSIASIFFLVWVQLEGKRLGRIYLWGAMIPLLMLSFLTAYGFDWNANANNDLSRWLLDVDRIKIGGFDAYIVYSDDFTPLWRVILWLVSRLNNYHWFPAISITIETCMFLYIVIDVYEHRKISLFDFVFCLVIKYSLVPFTMSAVGFRGTIAFMFFSIGVYECYKEQKNSVRAIIPMVLGVLIHLEIILGIAVFVVGILIKEHKVLNCLLVLWSGALGIITLILEKFNSAYFDFLLYKIDMYAPNSNNFDQTKVNLYIVPIVVLMLLTYYWYFKKSNSETRSKIFYMISVLPVIVGSYFFINLVFLRLCYSVGFLFPILIAEIGVRGQDNTKISNFNAFIYLNGILLALLTQGCWLQQTNGIFWTQ